MKSLLEIHQDVRELQKSIADIVNSVNAINSDIDELRNAEQETEIDYFKIEKLAQKLPFGKHPLRRLADDRPRQLYLEMLLNIVRLDKDEKLTLDRLTFIQWLRTEAAMDRTLEDLYKNSCRMTAEVYQEFSEVLPEEYREYFAVDALMAANIGGKANMDIYLYLADLFAALEIDRKRLETLSLVARTALCQSFDGSRREEAMELLDSAGSYEHYFEPELVKGWSKEMRKIVLVVSADKAACLDWKVVSGQKVKKDDVIAEALTPEKRVALDTSGSLRYTISALNYALKKLQDLEKEYNYGEIYKEELLQEIGRYKEMLHLKTTVFTAPSSGTIFVFRLDNIHYGVLSHKYDDEDSIKEWIRSIRQNKN